ncbi:hypothetical protein [Chryseobacterium polytrichastri]|uniref:CarboxypepD_reg-like domain-containing protein n=1 Tax=Chryseobacterium polytrichastri TaxID=1302687 RepID=A0A1M7B9E6_9FLAO|nr:hypothetical protein [Chryseobacterium polytrichastri]SHL51279.1 hypothetical protein SAMN05444267_101914 [Chryseobacterium polytrichastri]
MKPFLKIEKPCEESLEKMHDLPDGKFCDLCSKKVLDLSELNDSEILSIILQNKGEQFCGIVFKRSLNLVLQPEISFSHNHHPRKTSFTKIAAGLALTASMINSYPAQTKVVTKTEFVSSPSKTPKENQKKEDKTGDGNMIISGKVLIKGTNKPGPETTIHFITPQKVYSAKTDAKGFYNLEVPQECVKAENLLEFSPEGYHYAGKLMIFKKEDLLKKNTLYLSENDERKQYGDVSVEGLFANEKSLVFLGGKKLDYKMFNKSFSLFYNKYEVYYIPKAFIKVFTTDENINDLFITFVK